MRFREVERHIDEERLVKAEEKKENENYRKIKPESNMSVEEARSFWDSMFQEI